MHMYCQYTIYITHANDVHNIFVFTDNRLMLNPQSHKFSIILESMFYIKKSCAHNQLIYQVSNLPQKPVDC